MLGRSRKVKKGPISRGITAKAAKILESLIDGVDLHTMDIVAGPLKIHYISAAPPFGELISVGYYYMTEGKLLADPEFIFDREKYEGLKIRPNFEGSDSSGGTMYYPVSYREDTFGVFTECMFLDDDTFIPNEQKKIAIVASKWIREMMQGIEPTLQPYAGDPEEPTKDEPPYVGMEV